MLLGRVFVALVLQHIERLNQLAPGVARANHRVQLSSFCRYVRIGEAVAKLLDLRGAIGFGIF